MIFTRSKGS